MLPALYAGFPVALLVAMSPITTRTLLPVLHGSLRAIVPPGQIRHSEPGTATSAVYSKGVKVRVLEEE